MCIKEFPQGIILAILLLHFLKIYIYYKNKITSWALVARDFSPSTGEAEAGSLCILSEKCELKPKY